MPRTTKADILGQLDPANPATIQALIDFHRTVFGGFVMEAEETAAAETGATETKVETSTEGAKPDDLGDAGKNAIKSEREARRAAETARKAAEAELEKLKLANASEAEKAQHQARTEGKTEGFTEAQSKWLPRAVRAEFTAAAAGRLTKEQVDELLEDLDLSRYVIDNKGDIDIDTARIVKKIDALAPTAQGAKAPSFNGGARATEPHRPASLGDAITARMTAKS